MRDTAALSEAGLRRLHAAMAERVAQGELPGLVTLVARGDDVRVAACGGWASEGERPRRRDTISRIAPLTRRVTAAPRMMLVDEGALPRDEPVDRLLPELADRRVLRRIDGPLDDTVPASRPITIEDLLTFRLGHGLLTEPTFDPPFPIVQRTHELQLVMGPPEPRTPHDPDRWIELFGTLPLMHQPGERWQYNTGTLVLGVLLARAAGQPLEALLRTRVFEPLGMRDTGFSLPGEHVGRLPSQYTPDFQTGSVAPPAVSEPVVWTRPPAFPSGSAGLLSTADDYLAFARLLLSGGRHGDRRLLSGAPAGPRTANPLHPRHA